MNSNFSTNQTDFAGTRGLARSWASLVSVFCLLSVSGRAEEISFRTEIAPLLTRRCLGCHENRKSEGRYALHTFERLLKAGESEETPVVPGDPEASYLYQKMVETDPDLRMPQEDEPLEPENLRLVKQWIAEGAKFDGNDPARLLKELLPPRQHPPAPPTYRVPLPVFELAFLSDGNHLITSGWHELLVWEVSSGELLCRVGGLPQRTHSFAFSPDGIWLAVGGGAPGEYGEIRLLKVGSLSGAEGWSNRLLATWDDVVLDIEFTRDGRTLLAVGADDSVRAYSVGEGKLLWQARQHADWVTAVSLTDYRFAERRATNDTLLDSYDLPPGDRKGGDHLQQHWQFPNGRFIVRRANWELVAGLPTESPEVESLTKITETGIGKTYQVTREPITDFETRSDLVADLLDLHREWSDDEKGTEFVVTASQDRTVKVFCRDDGRLFTTYKGHRREYGPLAGMHRVFGVQAEAGTRRVWSGGEGKHFHGWDPVTVRDEDGTAADMEARFAKEYSTDLIRHDTNGPVFDFACRTGHLYAASAAGEVFRFQRIVVEDSLNKPAPRTAYAGHQDHLYTLAVSGDGRFVAAAGFSGQILIWDHETGAVRSQFLAAP